MPIIDDYATAKKGFPQAYRPKGKVSPYGTPVVTKPKKTTTISTPLSKRVTSTGTTKKPPAAKKTTTTKKVATTAAPTDYSYITAQWKPLIDQAITKVKQHYVDNGLLSSTAAGQSEGAAVAPIANAYASAMENAKNTDMSRAVDVWKALNAIGASRGAITGELKDYQHVADLPWFSQLFNTNFLAPAKSTGPTGDPLEAGQVVQRYKTFPDGGQSLVQKQMSQAATQFAENLQLQRDLQNQRIAAAAEENEKARAAAAAQAEKTRQAALGDPWRTMAEIAANPPFKGQPARTLSLIESIYGKDIVGMAAGGDPQAIDLLHTLYPGGTYGYGNNFTTVSDPGATAAGGWTLSANGAYDPNSPANRAQAAANRKQLGDLGSGILNFLNRGF